MTLAKQYSTVLSMCLVGFAIAIPGQLLKNETEAASWFREFDSLLAVIATQETNASWTYYTNLTDFNHRVSVSVFKLATEGAAAGQW